MLKSYKWDGMDGWVWVGPLNALLLRAPLCVVLIGVWWTEWCSFYGAAFLHHSECLVTSTLEILMKVAGVDDVRGDEATIMREVGGGSQRQRRRGRGGWKSDNCHLLTHTSNIEILLTLSEQKLHLKISGSNCHKNVLKRSIWLSDDWPWRLRCYEWFLWFQKLSELLIVLCSFFLNVASKKFNTDDSMFF